MEKAIRALILCTGDTATDPRPRRAVETLVAAGYQVELVSHEVSAPLGVERVYELPEPATGHLARLPRRLRTLAGMLIGAVIPSLRERVIAERFDYQSIEHRLAGKEWDVILVEEIYFLPLAFRLAGGARVVMDAREYYPRISESYLRFRLFQRSELIWVCRSYLGHCDRVITVSEGLAKEYAREFGIRPLVVRSIPNHQSLPVNPTDEHSIRLVHHGVANRNRNLENLVYILRGLDARFTLDLYLTGNPENIARIRTSIGDDSRVRLLPPVPFKDICRKLNEYDIGLFYVEPTTFNLRHCMPNKLFEFIQARLAVAIGPSPDMAALVNEHACGVVAPEFTIDSMVEALLGLNAAQIDALKMASDRAAETLRWEVESQKLFEALAP